MQNILDSQPLLRVEEALLPNVHTALERKIRQYNLASLTAWPMQRQAFNSNLDGSVAENACSCSLCTKNDLKMRVVNTKKNTIQENANLANEVAELLLPSGKNLHWDIHDLRRHNICHTFIVFGINWSADRWQPVIRLDVSKCAFGQRVWERHLRWSRVIVGLVIGVSNGGCRYFAIKNEDIREDTEDIQTKVDTRWKDDASFDYAAGYKDASCWFNLHVVNGNIAKYARPRLRRRKRRFNVKIRYER